MKCSSRSRSHSLLQLLALCTIFLLAANAALGFVPGLPTLVARTTTRESGVLFASKSKKKKTKKKGQPQSAGGGFGGGTASSTAKSKTAISPVRADKDSLEAQWDSFAAITDLEIRPVDDTQDFVVTDVFVRSGDGDADADADAEENSSKGTGWFRIGKVCADSQQNSSIEAALTLQRGLILWTAVHMRREFLALGKAGAASLELGYSLPAIVYMGSETDGPLEEDEADVVQVHTKAEASLLQAVETRTSIGFRPDWNPPGFTYKRRESAAMKKASSSGGSRLQEALGEESD